MKYTITAVIPTVQYGNIQPSIEVEAETFEEANAQAMPHIQKVWDTYGQVPLIARGGDRKLFKAFLGGEIYFEESTHTYTNEAGETYLSGSQYAKKFEKPFDAQVVSGAVAKKWEVDPGEVRKMWELKADISRGLGTMLHSALELYGRYKELAESVGKTTHLHDHPIVKRAVEGFYSGREGEIAEYEALVIDHKNKRVGRIDRLLITGDKRCRVQDYKTNVNLTPDKLTVYWEQLGFYDSIMTENGWTVEGLDIFAWDGDWKTHTKNKENNNVNL